MRTTKILTLTLLILSTGSVLCGCPTSDTPSRYAVVVKNLSSQPLGPVVAATHSGSVAVWERGQFASPGLRKLAETGEIATLVSELEADTRVSAVARTLVPMPSKGRVVPRANVTSFGGPDLVDTQSFEISGIPGDYFSIVSALLGTNDGFWGLDTVALPAGGSLTYFALGYDGGTEVNNEEEAFINDIASILGPVVIPGDEPDEEGMADNRHEATSPPNGIGPHQGITGEGDIPEEFNFSEIVVQLTLTRMASP